MYEDVYTHFDTEYDMMIYDNALWSRYGYLRFRYFDHQFHIDENGQIKWNALSKVKLLIWTTVPPNHRCVVQLSLISIHIVSNKWDNILRSEIL